MKKSFKLFLIILGLSLLTLGIIFFGFYVFSSLTQDYGRISPLKEGGNILYPTEKEKVEMVDSSSQNFSDATTTDVSDQKGGSVLNTKSNLTLTDIKNAVYDISENKESKFIDGKFEYRSGAIVSSSIINYAFGDVNGDGSGDAVVVTLTDINNSILEELHIVLNKNGLAKTFKTESFLAEGSSVKEYNSVYINKGKITLSMNILTLGDAICCPSIKKTSTYKLVNQKLILVQDEVVWKKYLNNKFGFEFMYPGYASPVIKPIFLEGKEVFDSLNILVPLRFENEYNTWTKKNIEVSVLKRACPFRNDAFIVTKNNIDFHFYNPSYDVTSNKNIVLKQEEYMATKVGYCFIITANVSGPGVDAPDYPKSSIIKNPDDINNFFDQEFLILNQILDTIRFI